MFKTLFNIPFKGVFVISLKRSHNRRKLLDREIKKYLRTNYKIIDAIEADNSKIELAYASGEVALFPPCFRCGNILCECQNNILIETQVATFYSHMSVWEEVAKRKDGLYLIMEDDIKFNWYFLLFKHFYYYIINSLVISNKNKPLLIRLAWALNEEHRLQRIKVKMNSVRMANPAYAITPTMARKLINNLEIIDTTVDLYVHKRIGARYGAYTIYPPIAHELSYSTGTIESLIRPRKERIKRISANKDTASQNELMEYANYIERIRYSSILVLGLPGQNIYKAQRLLKALGINLGKDEIADDGIISWAFSVSDLHHPYDCQGYARSNYFSYFKHKIVFIENARTAIPDIEKEIKENPSSYKYIRKHIKRSLGIDVSTVQDETNKAALIYIYWIKIIKNNHPTALILKQEQDLLSIKSEIMAMLKQATKNNSINVVSHTSLMANKQIATEIKLSKIELEVRKQLNNLCSELGYDPIFDSTLSSILN